MNERTNREKMLGQEEYLPDQELAELAIRCSEGLLYINSRPAREPERDAFLKGFFGAIGEHVTVRATSNAITAAIFISGTA